MRKRLALSVLLLVILAACDKSTPMEEVVEIHSLSNDYGDPKIPVDCGEDAMYYTEVQAMGFDPGSFGTIDRYGCWSYSVVQPATYTPFDAQAMEANADSVASGHYTIPTTINGDSGCCDLQVSHAFVATAVTLATWEQMLVACPKGRRFTRACLSAVVIFAAADYAMQFTYFALDECQKDNFCKWQIGGIAVADPARSGVTMTGGVA